MARSPYKTSRSHVRARLLFQAADVSVPASCDVAVVGGGGAGIACAIVAAEAGASVVVLECAPECARSILATGGGRCNLCNASLSPECYNNPAFAGDVLGADALTRILGFFSDCGLATCEEDEGRIYPASFSAASVREVLLGRAMRAGVVCAPARRALSIALDEPGEVELGYEELWDGGSTRTLVSSRAVIAIGGMGAKAVAGLDALQAPLKPVLCPLACSCNEGDLVEIDGRRIRCEATLMRAGSEVAREAGEILFRPYGISGILAFNLSRNARPGDLIALDLAPNLSRDEVAELVRAAGSLAGVVDPAVARWLEHAQGTDPKALGKIAKHLELWVEGVADASHAQVMRGGLSTDALDVATLALTSDPRILACGEAIDIDGACGGYNLAWAWASGMVAGRSAAGALA